jgi:hypothetical protein
MSGIINAPRHNICIWYPLVNIYMPTKSLLTIELNGRAQVNSNRTEGLERKGRAQVHQNLRDVYMWANLCLARILSRAVISFDSTS